MQAGQFAPGVGEGGEIGREGDARQLAFEVVGELLAVRRMVQDGVDVMEDVPLGDGGIAVVRAELFEGGVGDVLAAVGAVGGVGVEGEALSPPPGATRCRSEMQVGRRSHERLLRPDAVTADVAVLVLALRGKDLGC